MSLRRRDRHARRRPPNTAAATHATRAALGERAHRVARDADGQHDAQLAPPRRAPAARDERDARSRAWPRRTGARRRASSGRTESPEPSITRPRGTSYSRVATPISEIDEQARTSSTSPLVPPSLQPRLYHAATSAPRRGRTASSTRASSARDDPHVPAVEVRPRTHRRDERGVASLGVRGRPVVGDPQRDPAALVAGDDLDRLRPRLRRGLDRTLGDPERGEVDARAHPDGIALQAHRHRGRVAHAAAGPAPRSPRRPAAARGRAVVVVAQHAEQPAHLRRAPRGPCPRSRCSASPAYSRSPTAITRWTASACTTIALTSFASTVCSSAGDPRPLVLDRARRAVLLPAASSRCAASSSSRTRRWQRSARPASTGGAQRAIPQRRSAGSHSPSTRLSEPAVPPYRMTHEPRSSRPSVRRPDGVQQREQDRRRGRRSTSSARRPAAAGGAPQRRSAHATGGAACGPRTARCTSRNVSALATRSVPRGSRVTQLHENHSRDDGREPEVHPPLIQTRGCGVRRSSCAHRRRARGGRRPPAGGRPGPT